MLFQPNARASRNRRHRHTNDWIHRVFNCSLSVVDLDVAECIFFRYHVPYIIPSAYESLYLI